MHHGNQGIYTINTLHPLHYETQLDPNKGCSIADMPSSKNNIECDIENGYFNFLSTSKKKVSVILDVFIVLIVAALIILIELGVLPHRTPGFTCRDKKLSYEYNGDTIRISVLLTSCYTIPLIVLAFTEWKRYGTVDNVLFRRIWQWYKHFLMGITTMLILIEFIKLIVGEPRPHFFHTCRPDREENCTDGEYVTSYTCTNTLHNKWLIRDSSKSFPSGHAAMGMYAAMFCVWYLQKCLPNLSVEFFKPALQSLFLILSSWCALSRITDNRHHWWDVLFGTILGIIYSIYTIIMLCNNFKKKTPRSAHSTCTLLTDTTNRNATSVVL